MKVLFENKYFKNYFKNKFRSWFNLSIINKNYIKNIKLNCFYVIVTNWLILIYANSGLMI
jgi:hypothetical protein